MKFKSDKKIEYENKKILSFSSSNPFCVVVSNAGVQNGCHKMNSPNLNMG